MATESAEEENKLARLRTELGTEIVLTRAPTLGNGAVMTINDSRMAGIFQTTQVYIDADTLAELAGAMLAESLVASFQEGVEEARESNNTFLDKLFKDVGGSSDE